MAAHTPPLLPGVLSNLSNNNSTMKKSIIYALALAVPAFAGEPTAPVNVCPAPACSCPLALEVGPTYTYATCDLGEGAGHLDMAGVDLTAVYDLNDKWAITLRGAWATGDTGYSYTYTKGANEYTNDDIDGEAWSLMVGLRYTSPITENLSWFAGAQLGFTNLELEDDTASNDDTGVSYSIEGGLKYDLTKKLYVYGAVQATGCHATPAEFDKQYGIGVRAGIGFDF